MTRRFTGDFSTGDLRQWSQINIVGKSGNRDDNYYYGYPIQIISPDKDCGWIARVEVRQGDVPPFGGGERAEVQGTIDTDVLAGETAFYSFGVKFDTTFPNNHASYGWGDVFQLHDNTLPGAAYPPVIEWGWSVANSTAGHWYLTHAPQTTPGVYDIPSGSQNLLELPLNLGEWHDIVMEVKVSSNPAVGYVRVWWNGAPQTLLGGSTTFTGMTMVPTVTGVKVQQGYYRQAGISVTGIIYHRGCNIADSMASL